MIAENTWTPVTHVENIPPQEGRAVTIGGLELAIFNLKNRYRTVANKCPHQGGPLCDGIVAGSSVVCPLHGRRFDLETGMPVRASEPDCVTTFPTRVVEGIIYVDLSGAAL
jgi:nitrite reductase (NADH) small subunit